jgi:FkbM family methyltransferase
MNFMLNQIDAHQVVTKAVGVQCEDRYFSNLNEASPVNAFAETQENAILVKTTTLDVFFEHFPIQPQDHFIIKIDVEGYEHEVLQGARQFLRQAPIKAILFEGFSSHHQAIEAQLKALGFKLEIVSKHNILASRSKQEGEACEHKHLIPST